MKHWVVYGKCNGYFSLLGARGCEDWLRLLALRSPGYRLAFRLGPAVIVLNIIAASRINNFDHM
jgi:hypothetical protein